MTNVELDVRETGDERAGSANAAGLVRGFVLAAWAVLFWYFTATGAWSVYLAPRASALVPIAAVGFTVMALAQLVYAVRPLIGQRPEALTWGRMLLLTLVASPILIALIVAPTPLNSFAVGKRSDYTLVEMLGGRVIEMNEELTFQQLVTAPSIPESLEVLRKRAGEQIELTGIVTGRDEGENTFVLTRFIVGCCVVDARVATIPIKGIGAPLANDAWVKVRGTLSVDEDDNVYLDNAEAEQTEQPSNPYLAPEI